MIDVLILSIFAVTLFMIVWNKISRTIVVMISAVILVFLGEHFYFLTQEEALLGIDFNTIGLLIGMMILVAIIKKTGLLTYVAIKSAKLSQGNLSLLMVILGFVTAFLSMLIDNVTTLVIIGPTTILIADILGISAMPFLIVEVIFSNIGGVGTLIGDPPNIMISSAAEFSFNDFLFHLLPVVMIVLIILTGIVRFMFREEFKTAAHNFEKVMHMDEKKAIRGARGVKRSLVTLGIVLVLFAGHEVFHLEPAFVALFGASLALLLVRPEPDEIFKEVEWGVLFFFAGLFVMVKAVDNTGLFTYIARRVTHLADYNFSLCAIALMWASSAVSTFVGSIAFTAAAIPVIKNVPLAAEQVETLWWVLAIGAGFGGNGLPISSAAGVLCSTILARSKKPLGLFLWVKTGTILMLFSLLISSVVFLLFRHVFF